MLNYNRKGSVTVGTQVWIYYQDDVKTSIFYIVPQPTWVLQGGQPEFKLVTYSTDAPNSGSGYVTFNTQLAAPADVIAAVKADIPKAFPGTPTPISP